MSLISQQDRSLVIKALEFYLDACNLRQEEKMEVNALINWVKLQHQKNITKSSN